jgi:hypothetical protein
MDYASREGTRQREDLASVVTHQAKSWRVKEALACREAAADYTDSLNLATGLN